MSKIQISTEDKTNQWLLSFVEKNNYVLQDMQTIHNNMIETLFTHDTKPPITIIMNTIQVAKIFSLTNNLKQR